MTTKRIKVALAGILGILLIFAVACIFSVGDITSSSADSTVTLTGGQVEYVEVRGSTVHYELYKNLGMDDFDKYRRRVKITFSSAKAPSGSNEQTMYVGSPNFDIKFDFDASYNGSISKSWVTTRVHSVTLYRENGEAVTPSQTTGGAVQDADCSISNRYIGLADGKYRLSVYFYQGHGIGAGQFKNDFTYTQSIVVDTTAPKLKCSSMASASSVSATFTVTSSEAPVSATYTHNGTNKGAYVSGTTLTAEGKYIITATDAAGNSSSATLYVDKTAPAFVATSASKTSVNATWKVGTNESAVTATYSYNGTNRGEYVSGTALVTEGKYVVTAVDAAGNKSSVTMYVDKTAPVLSVVNYVSDRSVSAVFLAAAENESPITVTYSLNGTNKGAYVSGTALTVEGKYIITATDAAGNSSSATLYVDKTAPALVATSASKTSVNATWKVGTNESAVTAKYDLLTSDGWKRDMPYSSGTALTAEGKYIITATDAAGNSSSATLYVDRTVPTINAAPGVSKTSVRATLNRSEYESAVTVTYTQNGTNQGAYVSGTALTVEGKYIITATDAAGNSSSATLYVDKTAPILTATSPNASGGNVTWIVGEFESAVSATYAFNGSSKGVYTSGTQLTEEGLYTVTATDAAGNRSETSFIVDRTAPTLIYADGSFGAAQITRTSSSVSWTVGAYESAVTVIYSFLPAPGNAASSITDAPYASGNTVAAEGVYEFIATDAAGNETLATVVIDKTPPIITFTSNGVNFERYSNTAFTASGEDALSGIDKIELYEDGAYKSYDYSPRDGNGAYLFRVSDKAGNVTGATAVVFKTDTFGNSALIRDGYKVNAWYIVTLPSRIFTTDRKDIAGRYSFEDYDKALAFAVSVEREFRVTEVQGGYMYVSAASESISQKYETEASVLAVVEKYAKGYISSRQTASASGNDRYYTERDSLTRNSPILPDYLLDLKNFPRYFARHSTTWSLPTIPYISEMDYTVTARYLGDFEEENTQKEFIIPRGVTLLSAAKEQGEYKQGFYLITESDVAGNVERYVIYSDVELPTARVHAKYGDSEKDFVLDYDHARNETLYFISLSFEALLDNADAFVTMKLEKGNSVEYFTQSDVLPVLGSESHTSGKYTITLFDRSLNTLVVDVFIAGGAPTMTHGSLDADKPDCKISFATSDRFNVITGITIYKIEYDGSKTLLETDGDGTPITAATTSYTLTVGGKYGATVTDNYKRTIELEPIFFLKGLPSGKLSGVKDGGRTNKNVSFTFDSGDVAEFYTLHSNGERRPFNGFTVQAGAVQTTYNIIAEDETSHEYLVFLHNAQDLSLFVEYTFEIDTILPNVEITDNSGNVIEPDGATNKPFSIKWSETGVSVRYYTSKSGQLGATKYNMNTVLTQGALYYFTIKDDVGNTLDFTVLLDNVVDYNIDGKYNTVDGVLYANAPITFTVNEPTQAFDVGNENNYTIGNGGTLTQAGRYDITVTDNYRNTVKLVIVLDFTPPRITLDGAAPAEAVKNDVVVTAFDYDSLYLADGRGNKIRDVADGERFTEAGIYYITASDHAGNSATVSFSIDLSVDYTLSVPDGAVTTDKVTLDTAEPLEIAVKLNGVAIGSATKFSECGAYELELTDELGNSVTCVFTVIPRKAQTLNVPLPIGTRIVGVLRDGDMFELADPGMLAFDATGVYTVTLDCHGVPYELTVETDSTPPTVTLVKEGSNVGITAVDKENVEFKLMRDGKEINCRLGQTLADPGHYVLTVTDSLGNFSTYEFTIPFRLNMWAIVAIVVGGVALIVILILIIRARRRPRMK